MLTLNNLFNANPHHNLHYARECTNDKGKSSGDTFPDWSTQDSDAHKGTTRKVPTHTREQT